jgi:EAL domain-containing protein (putative c-di-GMP-specific phosphodiesterase class I)
MMSDLEAATATLARIKELGVSVSIDDFGTGHSSLAYLKRFPVSELKIDRSFVRDAPTNPDDATIVRAVIDLAHALGLRVVAEGVENDEQIALLRGLGCDWMQGFRLGRPLPVVKFETMLNDGPLRWVREHGGEKDATDDEEQASDCLI